MPTVEVRARCPSLGAHEAFSVLTDFERYPAISEAVHSVRVFDEDGAAVSSWEVNFRNGVLVWSEYDEVDPDSRTITFSRRDGDPDSFEGRWRVVDDEVAAGCLIDFRAEFDIGMGSMSDIVDPVATRTLYENILSIMRGVGGVGTEVLTSRPEAGLT